MSNFHVGELDTKAIRVSSLDTPSVPKGCNPKHKSNAPFRWHYESRTYFWNGTTSRLNRKHRPKKKVIGSKKRY